MKNVQIRDVPDDIHATLVARAESENKSLQTYLAEILAREARAAETIAFLRSLKPVRRESVVSTDEIVAMIRADRDSR